MPISAVGGVGWGVKGGLSLCRTRALSRRRVQRGGCGCPDRRGHSAFVAWGSTLCAKSVGGPGFLRIAWKPSGSKRPGGDMRQALPRCGTASDHDLWPLFTDGSDARESTTAPHPPWKLSACQRELRSRFVSIEGGSLAESRWFYM